jgi:hypothetical protein
VLEPRRGIEPVPHRSSIYRILVRFDLVAAKPREEEAAEKLHVRDNQLVDLGVASDAAVSDTDFEVFEAKHQQNRRAKEDMVKAARATWDSTRRLSYMSAIGEDPLPSDGSNRRHEEKPGQSIAFLRLVGAGLHANGPDTRRRASRGRDGADLSARRDLREDESNDGHGFGGVGRVIRLPSGWDQTSSSLILTLTPRSMATLSVLTVRVPEASWETSHFSSLPVIVQASMSCPLPFMAGRVAARFQFRRLTLPR